MRERRHRWRGRVTRDGDAGPLMSVAKSGRGRVVAIWFVAACSAGTGDSVRGLDADTRRIGAAVYGNHWANCHGARGDGMPAFESILTPREIHAVLTHLKAGWAPAQRRRQAEMSRSDPSPYVPRSP